MPFISVDTFIMPSENTINILKLLCVTHFSFTYYFFKYYISGDDRKKQTKQSSTILSGAWIGHSKKFLYSLSYEDHSVSETNVKG